MMICSPTSRGFKRQAVKSWPVVTLTRMWAPWTIGSWALRASPSLWRVNVHRAAPTQSIHQANSLSSCACPPALSSVLAAGPVVEAQPPSPPPTSELAPGSQELALITASSPPPSSPVSSTIKC